MKPKKVPLGRYQVVSINSGIGVDSMATAHAADFSVVLAAAGSTVKDMAVSLLHAQRTGIPTIVTWQSWWKQVQEEDPNVQQKMDVLSITTTLPTAPSNHFPKLKRSNEKGEMQDDERRP